MSDPPERPRDRAGVRAVVWSFFVPPAGIYFGVRGLISAARVGDRNARTESWLAIANGLFGTGVLVAAIILLPKLYHWYTEFLLYP